MNSKIVIAVLGLGLLQACRSACDAVAAEECPIWGDFIEACGEELEEAHISADCYPDPKGLADFLEDNPEDWSGAREQGLVEDCTSSRQAERSCEGWSKERRSRLEADEREAGEAACEQDLEEQDEWEQAMESQDCQYVVDLLSR